MNKQIFQIQHKLLQIAIGWLFTQHGRGVELGLPRKSADSARVDDQGLQI